jgi:hypothetical protein
MYRHLLDSMNGEISFIQFTGHQFRHHTWKPRSGARIKPRRKAGGEYGKDKALKGQKKPRLRLRVQHTMPQHQLDGKIAIIICSVVIQPRPTIRAAAFRMEHSTSMA